MPQSINDGAALLALIFERVRDADHGDAEFGADEARGWPEGALDALLAGQLLTAATPASVLICDGCQEACAMPVAVRAASGGRPAVAFIACDKPQDHGRIPVPLLRLARWRCTEARIAAAVAGLLGCPTPATAPNGSTWVLGPLPGAEHAGPATLTLLPTVQLLLAGAAVPLAQVLTFKANELAVNRAALDRIAAAAMKGLVPAERRKTIAQKAADALHDRPGGSRDKRARIRAIWASGSYTVRDRCAEEECGALGMSYSAARKALRNTPKPQSKKT